MSAPRPGARRVDVDELRRQHRAGWPQSRMAEHFNVTQRSISRYLRALGLTRPTPSAGKRMTEEWKAEARALLEGGASLIEIARTTGVAECTVNRHFRGQGWDKRTSGEYANAIRRANREFARLGHAPLYTSGPAAQHRRTK